jgi:hypothetical protein
MSAAEDALRARWGKPEAVDSLVALSLLGLPPRGDVAAFRYPCAEAAEAFAAAGLEGYGLAPLGTAETAAGVIGVVRVPVPPQPGPAPGG